MSSVIIYAQEPDKETVTTDQVTYKGSLYFPGDRRDIYGWLSIPYASPPIGNLRWKAPRPYQLTSSSIDTKKRPNMCIQVPLGNSEMAGSEDCLYLNVFRPDISKRNLPVMVWIHGGANKNGYSMSPVYSPHNFLDKHDVVFVSINYRLGPFGWFIFEGLNNDSKNQLDKTGNFGTLDIIMALKWVKNNIQFFSGNPNNITIFGESAGGLNVLSLMVFPLA